MNENRQGRRGVARLSHSDARRELRKFSAVRDYTHSQANAASNRSTTQRALLGIRLQNAFTDQFRSDFAGLC